MIVYDGNFVRVAGSPAEYDAPLVIDADRVLPLAVAAKGFESVAGWHPEVSQVGGVMEVEQLAPRDSVERGRQASASLGASILEYIFREPVPKALDHSKNVIGLR